MKIWLLIIACIACGVGGISSERRDSQSNTCQAAETASGKGGNTANQTGTNTGTTCTVEMAKGERLLIDMSLSEIGFLISPAIKPQIAVRIPQVLQKRIDYLNTMVKSPLVWTAKASYHGLEGGRVSRLRFQFPVPEIYAKGAGNDDHLPLIPPLSLFANRSDLVAYPAVMVVEGVNEHHLSDELGVSYDAIDYFANPKCPATITMSKKHRFEDAYNTYISIKFSNGNEIKQLAKRLGATLGMSFWMGRDNNLKMFIDIDSGSFDTYKTTSTFATFAACGVRMPEHDYECVISPPAARTCPQINSN